MADIMKQILAKPIQLADQIIKQADYVGSFKQDCAAIKTKTEKLAGLLRQAARASADLYERPTRCIIDDTEQVLVKTLELIFKCRANRLRRIFTKIDAAAFKKTSQQLKNSIEDVSWLLHVSTPADNRDDDQYLGLPPIAHNEPILCLIWEKIAILMCSGNVEERGDAAASLVLLARDNDRYGKLIIEEGGVAPLLKLAKEGRMEGQEAAARAVGLLGRDPESVEHIVNAGVCSVFAEILKDGPMKVQEVVAWAVSEMAKHHPKCQEHFLQNNAFDFEFKLLKRNTIAQGKGKQKATEMQESSPDDDLVLPKDISGTPGPDVTSSGPCLASRPGSSSKAFPCSKFLPEEDLSESYVDAAGSLHVVGPTSSKLLKSIDEDHPETLKRAREAIGSEHLFGFALQAFLDFVFRLFKLEVASASESDVSALVAELHSLERFGFFEVGWIHERLALLKEVVCRSATESSHIPVLDARDALVREVAELSTEISSLEKALAEAKKAHSEKSVALEVLNEEISHFSRPSSDNVMVPEEVYVRLKNGKAGAGLLTNFDH